MIVDRFLLLYLYIFSMYFSGIYLEGLNWIIFFISSFLILSYPIFKVLKNKAIPSDVNVYIFGVTILIYSTVRLMTVGISGLGVLEGLLSFVLVLFFSLSAIVDRPKYSYKIILKFFIFLSLFNAVWSLFQFIDYSFYKEALTFFGTSPGREASLTRLFNNDRFVGFVDVPNQAGFLYSIGLMSILQMYFLKYTNLLTSLSVLCFLVLVGSLAGSKVLFLGIFFAFLYIVLFLLPRFGLLLLIAIAMIGITLIAFQYDLGRVTGNRLGEHSVIFYQLSTFNVSDIYFGSSLGLTSAIDSGFLISFFTGGLLLLFMHLFVYLSWGRYVFTNFKHTSIDIFLIILFVLTFISEIFFPVFSRESINYLVAFLFVFSKHKGRLNSKIV